MSSFFGQINEVDLMIDACILTTANSLSVSTRCFKPFCIWIDRLLQYLFCGVARKFILRHFMLAKDFDRFLPAVSSFGLVLRHGFSSYCVRSG